MTFISDNRKDSFLSLCHLKPQLITNSEQTKQPGNLKKNKDVTKQRVSDYKLAVERGAGKTAQQVLAPNEFEPTF